MARTKSHILIESDSPLLAPIVWQVGALCRAVADALEARLNPVAVRGEVSSFTRAASGHCYFSIKDENAQIRCVMFRRSASLLDFSPQEGGLVEVRGRLGIYEARGDLQLIVESMSRAGAGALFEQFQKLKLKLAGEGLFDAARKRPLPVMPRGIGLVTSLGAAALHDVVITLQRRVPHIAVLLAPASVQGSSAPAELIFALSNLYRFTPVDPVSMHGVVKKTRKKSGQTAPIIDVILLVRGGGSIEDLWAFNDEQLARTMAQSPVPIICGVGHETDFSIADFVADLRAPTPTAAAEMVAQPRAVWFDLLDVSVRRMRDAALRQLDQQNQQLDLTSSRIGRPSARLAGQDLRLASSAQKLQASSLHFLQQKQQHLGRLEMALPEALRRGLERSAERLQRAALRLGLLDPSLVLQRGYAWLNTPGGTTVTSVQQTHVGQALRATLADGTVDLTVLHSI